MLERILSAAKSSSFAFRQLADTDAPRPEQHSESLARYRLIAAVAEVLQPQTILGFGEHGGIAGEALAYGCPTSQYASIAEGEKVDAQASSRSCRGVHDLVYIAVQQGDDSTYSRLEEAVDLGHHVLVDGCFQFRNGFLDVAEFLFRHKDVVEHALLIPGSSGLLLIKVCESHLERASPVSEACCSSDSLISFYDPQYYLADCGGFGNFQQTRGKNIDNEGRLEAMLQLALFSGGTRLLDLGCGRGEIAYQAAKQGMRVTAVDYSPDAIAIAKTCFSDEEDLQDRVEWVCGSAADLQLQGSYSTVLAGDLVEHMTYEELDRMYANLADHLEECGMFIVHTFPNKWFYQYDYPRRRRRAAELGAYLPSQPRTRYETLMHINEQSPCVLRRQLARHFDHVFLWFATPEDPGGSLLRSYPWRNLIGLRDLFAIASHSPVDEGRVKSLFQMQPLSETEASGVTFELLDCPEHVPRKSLFGIALRLQNGSATTLSSSRPHPVHLSYHWVNAEDGGVIVFDGRRSKIRPALHPGASGDCDVLVEAPADPGRYRLQVRLVQEFVRWYEAPAGDTRHDCTVEVM